MTISWNDMMILRENYGLQSFWICLWLHSTHATPLHFINIEGLLSSFGGLKCIPLFILGNSCFPFIIATSFENLKFESSLSSRKPMHCHWLLLLADYPIPISNFLWKFHEGCNLTLPWNIQHKLLHVSITL